MYIYIYIYVYIYIYIYIYTHTIYPGFSLLGGWEEVTLTSQRFSHSLPPPTPANEKNSPPPSVDSPLTKFLFSPQKKSISYWFPSTHYHPLPLFAKPRYIKLPQGYTEPLLADSLLFTRNSWYSLNQSQKDERLRRLWSHPVIWTCVST